MRVRRGVSLAALAPLVHYSKGYLSRVETGHRLPTAELARRCDEVLGADGELAGLVPAPARRGAGPRPAQLPAGVPDFIGRAMAMDWLEAVVSGGTSLVPIVVTGAPGVGKTALAVHFAHRVAARFPDGQLYVNLRGFDPSMPPVTPAAAVRWFLDALEVPAARIPADLDAQAGLYRSVLAGRRMLIVADNARGAAQIRPLLPGAPGCLVLITSRSQLTGFAAADGARLLDLDVLGPAEARSLLAARVGADRVAAEPEAVAEIVAACGRLPLALAVVAARAAARPRFPLQALAAELRDGCLGALAVGDDPAADVQAVFSWSYRALSGPAARLFRFLGLHPGDDISAPAAASLDGLPVAEVRPLLAELASAHLIGEIAPGRYALHDLLRAYARQHAEACSSPEQNHAASRRLADHYLHTAHAADRLLHPHREPIILGPPAPGVSPEAPAGHEQALAWFAAEHAALLAAVDLAANTRLDTHVWQLAWAVRTFLDLHGHWHAQSAVQQAGLAAAERLADPQAQALEHSSLASAYIRLRRLGDAGSHLEQALTLYDQAGDRAGQARAYLNLAMIAERQDRPTEVLGHSRLALELFQAAGHRQGTAEALNALGWSHAQLGDLQQALTYCQGALVLLEELGDRHGQADTWDSLGYAHHHLGHHKAAFTCYQHALSLYRDLGDRYYLADTLTRLGDAHRSAGDAAAADGAWRQALAVLSELDSPAADQLRAKLAASLARLSRIPQ